MISGNPSLLVGPLAPALFPLYPNRPSYNILKVVPKKLEPKGGGVPSYFSLGVVYLARPG